MAIFKLQLMMSLVALIVNDVYCTVLEKLFITTPFVLEGMCILGAQP